MTHLGQGFSQISPDRPILVGVAGYFLMEAADYFRRHQNANTEFPRWGQWSLDSCTAVSLVVVVLLMLASGGARNPFLYAIF